MTRKNKVKQIKDYDKFDTTSIINRKKPLSFKDLNISISPAPPTQVISIRLPTALLNEIKKLSSQNNIPYQSLIKHYLAEAVKKQKCYNR